MYSKSSTELSEREDVRKIGTVGSPHGVRGEFILFLESDFPKWVAELRECLAEVNGKLIPWHVKTTRFHQKKLIFAIEELPDRNATEAARGTSIFVPEALARKAVQDPDYYFNSDLIGLKMEAEGHTVGEVEDVFEMPAQNLLKIVAGSGQSFLFPFADDLIKSIDLENRSIQVILPDGLVEINETKKAVPKKPNAN